MIVHADEQIVDDAVEIIPASSAAPPILLTCEHASNRLPPPWRWSARDMRLVEQHWAWDPGAADITRRVASLLGAPAVLSRFSRLLIDPNRPLDSDTLFRRQADGVDVDLNTNVDGPDRNVRVTRFYDRYHAAVDAMCRAWPGADLVSMHSFTPCYEGEARAVHIGVLFDLDDDWGERWFRALNDGSRDVRRNEPWSGKLGLMHSVQSHAVRHGRRAIELEIRQDLSADSGQSEQIAQWIAQVIRSGALDG